MKLWVKIVILNVLVVIGLGFLVGLTVRDIVIRSMRAELTRQGESIATNLSDRVADSVLLDDYFRVDEAIRDVMQKERDIEYVFVTDKGGGLFHHSFENGYPPDLLNWNPFSINEVSSVQLLATEKGLIRDIGVRVFGGMNPELHIGIKEERIRHTLDRIRNLIIALTGVATLTGFILSFSLSRYITKPLHALVEFTHTLSKGDFGKRIEVKSKDEVGELSETFNNLSYELELYRKKMEESYKQMLRTEKMTALGRLSAGLAHELKNPLASIKVLFQTFKDNPSLTKEDMNVVLSAVGQMDDILTRFLRFARGDEFSLSDVYVNSLIKQVLTITQFQIKNQFIKINMELEKLPPIKADKTLIQQALLNIVLNAIESMPEGGVLTLSSRVEDSHMIVSVGDTGKGILDSIRDRVFDPFFTTKGDGTGLGLSIVYNIVSLHHGDITFVSNSEGTTFTLKFPAGVEI